MTIKRIGLSSVVLAASLALFAGQNGSRPVERLDPFSDWIVVKETAYGFLPPLRVSDASVDEGEWSKDGRFYVGLGKTDQGPVVVRYAVGTAKATTISLPAKGPVRDFKPIVGGLYVFCVGGTNYLFDANLQTFRAFEGTKNMEVSLPPRVWRDGRILISFAKVSESDSPDEDNRLLFELRPNGAILGPIKIPSDFFLYGVDGSILLGAIGPWVEHVRRWNGTEWVPAPDAKVYIVDTPSNPGEFVSEGLRDVRMDSGTRTTIGVIVYDGDDPPKKPSAGDLDRWSALPTEVVVSAPLSEKPRVSPTLNAVAYLQNGVLYIRPTIQVPVGDFRKALRERWKKELLNNVKEAGIALTVYAADYDDVFPDGFDFFNKLMPYVKNGDILSSFIYTFPGGESTNINDPAITELGYIPGPGGRAVVYADGHAKWIPDK
ncbi:MAG: hypothetical protein JST35_02345 [Armatimonadetes bacterium]|nr:hypothetical protein [Armatimonadota bacterium]